jgi:uncharacterized protein YxjI
MRYVMKQKLLAWGDDFTIRDENGQDRFYVDGKVLSWGDKLSFQDMQGHELAFISQKLMNWGPTYEIWRGGGPVAVVKKHLWTMLKYRFSVDVNADGPGAEDLEIEGDFWAHEYAFIRAGSPVAQVSKQWFTWADTYGISVPQGEDDVLVLACAVVVDLVTQQHKDNH